MSLIDGKAAAREDNQQGRDEQVINPDYLLDTIIDHRYRLTRFIGRGSFGWVYEAAEELHGEMIGRVAIKILSPEDEEQIFNILKEIRGLSQLRHENVIAYMSSGSIKDGVLSGSLFLATELGDTSLQEQIEGRKIKEETVHQMAICIAKALSYIHQSGAVHRDVKPANIFRVRDGWKLADFGLVRSVKGTITKASGQRGTLAYISPEIIEHGDVGPVSDVYSLGVTILESLTGRIAHEGTTEGEFIKKLIQMEASIPEGLDSWWKGVLKRCLEKDPRKRISSDELFEYLVKGKEEEEEQVKKSYKKSKRKDKKDLKKVQTSKQKKKLYTPKDRVSHSTQGVDFYMRLAPASAFPIGTDDSGSAIVDHDFWIAETQVTYELWYEVRMWALDNGYIFANMGMEGSITGGGFFNFFNNIGNQPTDAKQEPVTMVSWYDSIAWCNALSEYLGLNPVYTINGVVIKSATGIDHTNVVAEDRNGFRLPTSMEWELAARYKGSDRSLGAIEYPTGSNNYWTPGCYASGANFNSTKHAMEVAWYRKNSKKTQKVGQKPSCGNYLGIFDMSGNVSEWCFTQSESCQVWRGGSWKYSALYLQVGSVLPKTPSLAYNFIGFRFLRNKPDNFEEKPDDNVNYKTTSDDKKVIVTNDKTINERVRPGQRISHRVNTLEFYMRLAPASTFPTGIDDSGSATVDHNFWVAETPVTYELWYEVRIWAEKNGYAFANVGKEGSHGSTGQSPSNRRNEPVTRVNWYDSIAWCNALSGYLRLDPVYTHNGVVIKSATGLDHTDVVAEDRAGFRLPTSIEWELAARYKGNNSSHGAIEHPSGSENYWTPGNYASGAIGRYHKDAATQGVAWYWKNSNLGGRGKKTQDVGKKPSSGNVLGVFDMSGNVWEWCFTQNGSVRVDRGGSWGTSNIGFLRVGSVYNFFPGNFSFDLGFRFVRTHF